MGGLRECARVGEFDELRRAVVRQGGFVTAAQAVRLGFSRDRVRHLVRSGRWIRLSRGCYLPMADPPAAALRRTRIRATVASLGPGAVAVLDTAAELHGIGGLQSAATIHCARLIAEADGRVSHLSPDAVFADRFRQNRLVNAGWRILRFTWADTLRPDYIPATVRQALRRAC
ncbi:type IV toxin-antitoxin system AbiEi family antitoxin domain-containing protein [Micromonospora sp. WMMA1998]|uniref:type IV toxin-antitoxin system AbiEi family antitoxin domain-containing protein n=1 Tax=Micromonospora sp. WMMA1998 TaxID=3015167 RepID=UPI00248A9227|nr:type IV toxin-antitoxin system AbiEi family antitoxin domain-containing protein [Micromonospora sp. WMMA1998]WBC13313.1 type IV toxin-antitoxin system AbiEi family antitoxin domain-containing protein [Micromonospora sp. WMMA1998]